MPAELAAFGVPALALLTLGGVLVGISKTSFGGIGAVSAALFARFRSRQDATFGDKLLSAMRFGFGGHVEPPQ